MTTSPFLIVWGSEPGAGRRTISQAMAAQYAARDRQVLYVSVNSADLSIVGHDPLEWMHRFKALSPVLLRNYLRDPAKPYSSLQLNALPDIPTIKELIPLLRNAFEWIIWTSPLDWSPESLGVLDQAQLLLWIVQDPQTLKPHLTRLTSAHYPRALSQVVLNKVSEQGPYAGEEVISRIPREHPPGVLFRQGVQKLLDILETRSDGCLTPCEVPAFPAEEVLVENLKNRMKPRMLETAGPAPSVELAQKTLDTCLAEESQLPSSREQRTEIYTRVLQDMLGLGPLEPFLEDPEVSEVMVNGAGHVFLEEKKGKLHAAEARFSSDTQLRTVIDRIVSPIGRRVDESSPLCDARLADGSRVNIVLPPLALDGPTLTIRKFMTRALSLTDLVEWQSLSSEMADFLRVAILQRRNMVVAGGTGSGKTTLLNALSGAIPDDERIITIEDAAELRLQKPHVVRLESRPPNTEGEGAIPIRRLVINALRMRPDRIVVGECRGGEALDMLQAMNTGHDGSLTTLHANSCRDALRRLETLVLMAGMDLPLRVVREQIQSAVHLVIHQSRLADGTRKVVSITEVTGMEGEVLTTQELFHFRENRFQKTGLVSHFTQAAR